MIERNLSASPNRVAEDIGIHAVIIPELKFGDVQMQILFADFVERPHDTAFQDRPETFDGLSVDRAINVLTRPMIDNAMRIALLREARIARPIVSAKQADFVRDGFIDERGQYRAAYVLNDAGDDVAFAADHTDNDGLALSVAFPAALVPMPVATVTADSGFIDLDDSAKLFHVLDQGGSDLVAHQPSRLVRTEAHVAVDSEGAHALLTDQHQVRDSEPILERLIRIFKNCPSKIRETVASIAARRAFRALPMPLAGVKLIDRRVATARAMHAIRPAPNDQIRFAVVLSLKQRIELRRGHLMDGFRLLCAGHGNLPRSIGGQLHV